MEDIYSSMLPRTDEPYLALFREKSGCLCGEEVKIIFGRNRTKLGSKKKKGLSPWKANLDFLMEPAMGFEPATC